MRLLLITAFALNFNELIDCAGLNEEFSWTRITFLNTESRFYRPERAGHTKYSHSTPSDVVFFPDESAETKPSSTEAPIEQNNDVNDEYIVGESVNINE